MYLFCKQIEVTRCLDPEGKDGPPICEDVELGKAVDMTLSVTLQKCISETFVVYPIGLSEQLVVEVEPICSCECSQETFFNQECNVSY